jgi:hypothetical protein
MSASAATQPRLADGTPYVGQLGKLTHDRDEDKVQCHLCGGWYRMLGSSHLRRKVSVVAFDASLVVRK